MAAGRQADGRGDSRQRSKVCTSGENDNVGPAGNDEDDDGGGDEWRSEQRCKMRDGGDVVVVSLSLFAGSSRKQEQAGREGRRRMRGSFHDFALLCLLCCSFLRACRRVSLTL